MKKTFFHIITLMAAFASCLSLTVFALAAVDTDTELTLRQYLNESLEAIQVPNAAVLVVDKNEIVFEYTKGDVPSSNSKFGIGSMSKSFTALAVMQLVEDGNIDLDAPISAYLSEDILDPAVAQRVKVRQLLNQDSGIHDYYMQDVKTLHEQGVFYYANANFSLAGQIIESVAGMPYAEYVEANIFKPLGMTNSTASLLRTDDSFVQGYRVFGGFPVKAEMSWKAEQTPAGYIASTAADMGKYLQMHMHQGAHDGNIIASPSSVARILDETVPFASGEDAYYGMGWGSRKIDGIPYHTHGGNVETFSSFMNILPEQDLAFVMLFSVVQSLFLWDLR